MPNTSKAKIIALVIMAITVLLVAFFIVKENFALSQEGKIISRASITDTDGDGLTDEEEAKYKTNPNQADSDGDGVSDLEEIQKGTDPNKADQIPGDVDSDGDGLTNDEEAKYGTDPFNPDTDQDGYSDGQEIVSGYDPLTPCEGCEGRVAGDWSEGLESLAEGLDPEVLLENIDTSPVELPEILDSELNITDASGKKAVKKYYDSLTSVLSESTPCLLDKSKLEFFGSQLTLALQTQKKTDELVSKIKDSYNQIKAISVPKDCIELQKKTLGIYLLWADLIDRLGQSYREANVQEFMSLGYKFQSLRGPLEDCANDLAQNIPK